MPYFGIDKATQAKIDAGISDGQITIHIEPYAQSRPVPAIEAPRQVLPLRQPQVDVVANDKEVPLHRNTPPTPEPKVEKYAQFEVVDGVAQPIVTSESKHAGKRYVYDQDSGEYKQEEN